MATLPLFDVETVPSPICMFDHCQRKGRAVLGPPRQMTPDCVNRSVACECGRRGELSTNLRAKSGKAAA